MTIPLSDPTLVILGAILAVSTIITFLDYVGFLPPRISKWISRNRIQPTVDALRELGVDVDRQRRMNAAAAVPKFYSATDIEATTTEMLRPITIRRRLNVGSVDSVASDYFVDLMGTSVEPQNAERFARLLASHWRKLLEEGAAIAQPRIEFVVAPKSGAPILAYEFARILKRPLVLHVHPEKFQAESPLLRSTFDFADPPPPPGSAALIVDDSTTGGSKALAAVEALRRFGYVVQDCLVVFEPTIKNARKRLEDAGVRLHSIVRT